MVSDNPPREAGNGTGGDVVRPIPQYSTEQYRDIQTWDDALAMAQGSFGELVTAEDLGDGFKLVKEEAKAALVGVPMLCLYAQLRVGELGGYVVTRCITKDNRKVVIVDGGTGIYEQLNTYMTANGGHWPNIWPQGLRRSDYKTEIIDTKTGEAKINPQTGEPLLVDATTFYIDTSAS